MSSSRSSSQKPTESSQFIRPTSKLDTASAAERLALKGAGLASSDEVAAAIREGVATELADAVMAALGNRFECLSDEDVRTLAELYTVAPSATTTEADATVEPEGPDILAEREQCKPLLSTETGGDEAAGSPAASTSAGHAEKGALSSPEDDLSLDESPCGDGRTVSVELPVDRLVPSWRRHG